MAVLRNMKSTPAKKHNLHLGRGTSARSNMRETCQPKETCETSQPIETSQPSETNQSIETFASVKLVSLCNQTGAVILDKFWS